VSDPRAREIFYEYHRDLLDPAFWAGKQERVRSGVQEDVFPYPERFAFLEIEAARVRDAFDRNAFRARFEPGNDAHVSPRHAEIVRQELDQRRVGLAFHRRRGEPELDALPVPAGEFRALRARLDM
jgi:hypothetical protein